MELEDLTLSQEELVYTTLERLQEALQSTKVVGIPARLRASLTLETEEDYTVNVNFFTNVNTGNVEVKMVYKVYDND